MPPYDNGIPHACLRRILILRLRQRSTHLEAVATREFLRSPPGNRLEVLRGDREGQHSVRENDHWRICFRWTPAGAEDVEIVGYH